MFKRSVLILTAYKQMTPAVSATLADKTALR